MNIRLTAVSLVLALAAVPALAQATGGAGSATAGGIASPGNVNAGTRTDFAAGKSNVTPSSPAVTAAPGIAPSQSRTGTTAGQSGPGAYQAGTPNANGSNGSEDNRH